MTERSIVDQIEAALREVDVFAEDTPNLNAWPAPNTIRPFAEWLAARIEPALSDTIERPNTITEMGTEWVELADWQEMLGRWETLGRVARNKIDRLEANHQRVAEERDVFSRALTLACKRFRDGQAFKDDCLRRAGEELA